MIFFEEFFLEPFLFPSLPPPYKKEKRFSNYLFFFFFFWIANPQVNQLYSFIFKEI